MGRCIFLGVKILLVIVIIYVTSLFIYFHSIKSQAEYNDEEISRMFNYIPCEFAVATAMCRGPEPAKGFRKLLAQTVVMFKSILIREKYYRNRDDNDKYLNSCLDLCVISDNKNNFDLLVREMEKHGYNKEEHNNVRFIFVPSIYPKGCETFSDLYGPCASIRLFLDKILPNYDSILYVDSDVIFLQNIQILWTIFKFFERNTWAAFGPDEYGIVDHHHVPYYGQRGINSGVAFLNLTKMRETQFFNKIRVINKMFGQSSKYPDQDFLNFYFHQNPDEIFYLNCGLNYFVIFCVEGRLCYTNEIQILHGAAKTFQLPFGEPLIRSVFRIVQRTRLDLNVSGEEFGRRFEQSYLQAAEFYNVNTSLCMRNVDDFNNLLLQNIRI